MKNLELNLEIVIIFASFMVAGQVHTAELKGVTLNDTEIVAGKTLVLNGIGLRTATVLNVKVYVMGMYLEAKSTDAKAIINSPQKKRIIQHYVRDIKREKLVEGWEESFIRNNDNIAEIEKEFKTFLSYIEDIKKGEPYIVDFIDDRVELTVAGNKKAPIKGTAFQKAMLRAWLGPNPTMPELKDQILGK